MVYIEISDVGIIIGAMFYLAVLLYLILRNRNLKKQIKVNKRLFEIYKEVSNAKGKAEDRVQP